MIITFFKRNLEIVIFEATDFVCKSALNICSVGSSVKGSPNSNAGSLMQNSNLYMQDGVRNRTGNMRIGLASLFGARHDTHH